MIKLDFTFFNFYALFLIMSLMIGIILIDIDLKKIGIELYDILILNLVIFVFSILFGLLLTMFENYIFNHNISFGLSSYGGLIGFILSTYIYSKIFKFNFKLLIKIIITKIPLIYSISKLGCFFAGCCYGIEYNGIGNVIYISSHDAPLNINLFPIQLVESIVFMTIFLLILFYSKKTKKYILPLTFILCGLFKYLLEFLRASYTKYITFTQSISLICIIIGLYLFYKEKKIKMLYTGKNI